MTHLLLNWAPVRRPWLLALSLLLLVASHALIYRYGTTRRAREVVLVVNGQQILRDQLDLALTHYRDQALTDLGKQVVVAQQAQRLGVEVDDEDIVVAQEMDPPLRQDTLIRRRTELLFRKLVMDDVKKAEKEEVFRTFSSDLMGLKLSFILLSESADYAALDLDLRNRTSFEQIRDKYGKCNPPEITPELRRPLRPAQLGELFGRLGSAQVLALAVGGVSRPLQSGIGMVVVRLEEREDSYDQLEPAIDQLLFEAKKNRLLEHLAESTSISSPLTWSATRRTPPNIYGETPKKLTAPQKTRPANIPSLPLPRPAAKSTPSPQTGASLLAAAPPVRPLRLKLDGTGATGFSGLLKGTLKKETFRVLPDRWNKAPVLRLDGNNNHHADASEPILVRITADGWQAVDELTDSVNRHAVEQDLGYWIDRPVTRQVGPFWARKTEVVRAANGLVEPEEVTFRQFRRRTQLFQTQIFDLGAEIVRDSQGRLTQHEQRMDFGRASVDRADIERMKTYCESDGNWAVDSI